MAITGQKADIFKKVALSEKKILFREVSNERVQIMVKGVESEDVFQVIAMQTERDEVVRCQQVADTTPFNREQKVIASFMYHDERYYFNSDMNFQDGWIVLKVNVDLFQLQRRSNARVEIPESFDGTFILSHHVGRSYFVECRVKDVSAGGFKMEFVGDAPSLKVGDHLKGTLRLGKRRPMEFQVEVRFVRKGNVAGVVIQTAGVQFLNRDHATENRLLSMMMDLQRELYLKYSDRG